MRSHNRYCHTCLLLPTVLLFALTYITPGCSSHNTYELTQNYDDYSYQAYNTLQGGGQVTLDDVLYYHLDELAKNDAQRAALLGAFCVDLGATAYSSTTDWPLWYSQSIAHLAEALNTLSAINTQTFQEALQPYYAEQDNSQIRNWVTYTFNSTIHQLWNTDQQQLAASVAYGCLIECAHLMLKGVREETINETQRIELTKWLLSLNSSLHTIGDVLDSGEGIKNEAERLAMWVYAGKINSLEVCLTRKDEQGRLPLTELANEFSVARSDFAPHEGY